jgi:predicted GNAT family N-acyltransferase
VDARHAENSLGRLNHFGQAQVPASPAAVSSDPVIRPVANHEELLAALAVRVAVFVEEQGGPRDEEPDMWDPGARHFVVMDQGRVVGTARLYYPAFGVGKIGRVALLPSYRRRGWGRALMRTVLEHARALNLAAVVLDAQTAAAPLYESFGFMAAGEEYLDAGIPHRRMRLGWR